MALGATKEKSINSLTLSNELQITKGELKKLLDSKKKEVFVLKILTNCQSIFLQTNEKEELNESLDKNKIFTTFCFRARSWSGYIKSN